LDPMGLESSNGTTHKADLSPASRPAGEYDSQCRCTHLCQAAGTFTGISAYHCIRHRTASRLGTSNGTIYHDRYRAGIRLGGCARPIANHRIRRRPTSMHGKSVRAIEVHCTSDRVASRRGLSVRTIEIHRERCRVAATSSVLARTMANQSNCH
jgi:hypothetical protein